MKISVVTACYNASSYIRTSLLSVINQHYRDLEFIIIDGGSSDGTIEIVSQYLNKISYFVSERDEGQYHAIAKGLSIASGDVICWLNADDIHMPWTLSVVSDIFTRHPSVRWITGLPAFANRSGQLSGLYGSLAAFPRKDISLGRYDKRTYGYLQQESMFWRRDLMEQVGGLDLNLKLAADFELWTRFATATDLVPVNVPLAAFRKLPGEQRSSISEIEYESEVVSVQGRLRCGAHVKDWIGRLSTVTRSLLRLVSFAKTRAIFFDDRHQVWRLTSCYRSRSRVSLGELALMSLARSKKN